MLDPKPQVYFNLNFTNLLGRANEPAKCPAKVISRVGGRQGGGGGRGPRLHNVPIDLSADDLIKYRRTAL